MSCFELSSAFLLFLCAAPLSEPCSPVCKSTCSADVRGWGFGGHLGWLADCKPRPRRAAPRARVHWKRRGRGAIAYQCSGMLVAFITPFRQSRAPLSSTFQRAERILIDLLISASCSREPLALLAHSGAQESSRTFAQVQALTDCSLRCGRTYHTQQQRTPHRCAARDAVLCRSALCYSTPGCYHRRSSSSSRPQ